MNPENNKENNSSSHFLIGVAIGAALTALFTTKTGRKILHEVTSNGAELLDGKVDIDSIVQRVKRVQDEDDAEIDIMVESPAHKRVFKGIKKKP